jgi:hypothetical protein
MIELPNKETFTREEVLELLEAVRKLDSLLEVKKRKKKAPVEPKPKKPKEPWQMADYLLSIPEEDLDTYSQLYEITKQQVQKAGQTCYKWMKSQGILYFTKDYKSRLELWLDRDHERRATRTKEATPNAPKFDNIDSTDFP